MPRPKGSKNGSKDVIQHSLPRCARCHGTQIKILGNLIRREIAGVRADGTRFTSVSWRRGRCADCGHTQTVQTFEFDPQAVASS